MAIRFDNLIDLSPKKKPQWVFNINGYRDSENRLLYVN